MVGSGGTAERVRGGAVGNMMCRSAVVLVIIAGVSSSWTMLAAASPEEEFQNILKVGK